MPIPGPERSPDELLRIALLLKAARTMRGRISKKGTAIAMRTSELATLLAAQNNAIAKDRLEKFEQMIISPRDVDLEAIARALDLPAGYFDQELSPAAFASWTEQLLTAAGQVASLTRSLPETEAPGRGRRRARGATGAE